MDMKVLRCVWKVAKCVICRERVGFERERKAVCMGGGGKEGDTHTHTDVNMATYHLRTYTHTYVARPCIMVMRCCCFVFSVPLIIPLPVAYIIDDVPATPLFFSMAVFSISFLLSYVILQ